MRISLLILVLLVGCISKQTNENQLGQYDSSTTNISSVEQIDSLSFESVRINDKVPLKLKEKELLKELGQPDSIITERGWDCGNYLDENDSVVVYYYGHSRYIVSNGEVLLHKYYPSDNKLIFRTKKFQLSGEINELKIKELFSKSYECMERRIKNEKSYGKRRLKVGMSRNPISIDDNGFIFYFENNKLTYVELWWFIC